MIDAGAIGGSVGGHLGQAGREIDFLVRPRRAAELSQRRLHIVDGTRTETIDARTVTVSSLAGPYDLVLVGVKAQALPAAITDSTAAVGPDTVVLPFLNGITHIATLGNAIGRDALLGGVLKGTVALSQRASWARLKAAKQTPKFLGRTMTNCASQPCRGASGRPDETSSSGPIAQCNSAPSACWCSRTGRGYRSFPPTTVGFAAG